MAITTPKNIPTERKKEPPAPKKSSTHLPKSKNPPIETIIKIPICQAREKA